ncbi:MAG: basic secretory protein-like protein [Akkermansiaceae bacterium]
MRTGQSAASRFSIQDIPMPAENDAAAGSSAKLLDGEADRASGPLTVLFDGKVPGGSDDPGRNFFFAQGSKGGRIMVDLGKEIEVGSVVTYSWHRSSRAAQRYDLYGSDAEGVPKAALRPAKPGDDWELIESVDTSALEPGQHGVVVEGEKGENLGRFRYLIFDVFPNKNPGPFNETFYSEIDVIDANGEKLKRLEPPKIIVKKFPSKSGKFTYVVDSSDAPDLADWAGEKLIPVMDEWYPEIIKMLPVPGITPSTEITFTLKEARNLPKNMKGVPAYASGASVVFNADFVRREIAGEAIGAGIHEIVHVVQFGGRDKNGRITRGKRLPTWVTEGAADYIRWFLFEPEKRGARINHRNFEKARHDSSYRITAHFFDWVIKNYDKNLMRKINLSIHQGYREELWKEWTGKTVTELAAEWREANRKRLGL